MSRFLAPEIVRLTLSHGDWITVKKHLTAGELRRVKTRMLKPTFAGEQPVVNFDLSAVSQAAEYLIDWNFTDATGRPVVIRDLPADLVIDILNSLDADSFEEIHNAIEAHILAVAAEKKSPDTASVS